MTSVICYIIVNGKKTLSLMKNFSISFIDIHYFILLSLYLFGSDCNSRCENSEIFSGESSDRTNVIYLLVLNLSRTPVSRVIQFRRRYTGSTLYCPVPNGWSDMRRSFWVGYSWRYAITFHKGSGKIGYKFFPRVGNWTWVVRAADGHTTAPTYYNVRAFILIYLRCAYALTT